MPEVIKEDEFAFGVPTLGSESAKDVLYPAGREKEERPEVSAMYNKTHGAFGPGEQKHRNYVWPIPETKHRFGYAEEKVPGGTSLSLHPERVGGTFPKTVIVKKTVEDFKAVAQDILGQPKNLGQGAPPVPQDHSFGKARRDPNEWNAAMCLTGMAEEKELEPDRDLGKCVKQGCRN